MADPIVAEPIVNTLVVKGEEFPNVIDGDKALVLAIQELTQMIRRCSL